MARIDPQAQSPAGGVSSSAKDMAAWLRLQLADGEFYGPGIGVGTDDAGRVRYSHSGAFLLGAATTVSLLPSENLGIVVLTNGAPQGAPRPSAQASWASWKPARSVVTGSRPTSR